MKKHYFEALQEKPVDYKLVSIKKLIASIVFLSFNDLNSYIKNPQKYENYLIKNGDSPLKLINFWTKDAFSLISFVIGSYKAKIFMQKVNIKIKQAKKIYFSNLAKKRKRNV